MQSRRSPRYQANRCLFLSQNKSTVRPAIISTNGGVALCFGLILFLASLVGCAKKGPERIIVSGNVTYDGEPVSEGTIQFTPLATSRVPSASASIVDGKYKVDLRGGVPVGTHRISIEAYHYVPHTLRPGEAAPRNYFEGKLREQYLPKKYNANSQLELTIESGSDAIAEDFNLTS